MKCRNCGAEIAEKALICYRCGTATTEAKYQPAQLPRRSLSTTSRTLVMTIVIIALLALLALYFGLGMR